MVRRILRLYCIHIFACLAIALSMYFPGLDLALAIIYLISIGIEAGLNHSCTRVRVLVIILIWQLPGLILSLTSIAPAGMWGQANYAFFILEFWYTPLVPLLSCLSGWVIQGKPLYYYLLLGAPIIIGGYYYLLAVSAGYLNNRIGLKKKLAEIQKSQRT